MTAKQEHFGLLNAVIAAFIGLFIVWQGGPTPAAASVQVAQVPLPGKNIPKWIHPLPTFVGARVNGTVPLTVSMEEFQQKILPDSVYAPLAAPFSAGTYVWSYKIHDGVNTYGPHYPAFTIEAQKGLPSNITYVNNLVNPVLQKYITVDQTIHWADPLMQMGSMTPYSGPVPAVVHLHGGEVPSEIDGGPDAWFTPGLSLVGPAWSQGVSNIYSYPNTQEPATLWYHDHGLGVTRTNVYSGLAGFYLLRDNWDTGIAGQGVNLPAGPYEVELAIQDRMFDTNGQLLFPDQPPLNPEHPFWQPEFFGDVIVVNGRSWPFLNVEPRRYRLRLLDGSNARFYELWLQNQATGVIGPSFWQVGTDGGLLQAPVMVNGKLLIAPGERVDVIVDFSGYAGQTLTLRNSAKAPYPAGVSADPQTTGQIMQFRVVSPLLGADTSYNPAVGGPLRSTPIVALTNGAGGLAAGIVPDVKRQLTLNEVMGMPRTVNGVAYPGGPIEVLVNNTHYDGHPPGHMGGGPIMISEMPQVGATEVWEIINTTADAHPIHLHLVQFQLLSRQDLQMTKYMKAYNAAFPGGGMDHMTGLPYPPGVYMPAYGPPLPYDTPNADGAVGGNPAVTAYVQGPVKAPLPNEIGWKDTVIMYPGEVTRIAVRWAPTTIGVGLTQKGVNQYSFNPTTGPGYVWHCHIVDHEDNEMMRPYKVKW